ncbi:flagellin [Blastochloris viridis]|uniref:Flagellar hook-associated protein FlgL n=1 Tax=Blastochloris viridis TaxID=1079 RepID=A0A0H5BC09_BLAVI|nr:flagellin [Blastochloris viridis]ALK08081.1 flagellar hook-associated protein FlgL [Blastochloris viridis]BAR98659.1 flagellar hook-associated protein FlgL [Blastochloris viridis]CUU44003.1 flagellar hook-associated protein FlgL [Blastochloris viridis]
MAIRVATFHTSSRILTETLRTQARLSELQLQEATGKVSTDYGGLGTSASRLLNLEVSKSRAQSYATAASLSLGRVEEMYDVCGSIVTVLTELRSKISQATGTLDSTSAAAIQDVARNLLGETILAMNRQYEGRYLFAGDAVNSLPVDEASLPATESVPISTDTAYYQGGSQKASVRLSNDEVLTYGYLASDTAFSKALHVLNLVATVDISSDDAAAAEANTAVLEAIDAMTTVQTMLSLHAQTLERVQQDQLDYIDYADSAASSIGEVDIAAVQVSISTYTAQLQASYSAIAKVAALRLSDYLS